MLSKHLHSIVRTYYDLGMSRITHACERAQTSRHPYTVVVGPVFLDVIVGKLARMPQPGEEQWVERSALMAGGSANQAIALTRLGAHVELITNLGTDAAGKLVKDLIEHEGVSLTHSEYVARQNITVSQVLADDRAFTTAGSMAIPALPHAIDPPDVLLISIDHLRDSLPIVRDWRSRGTIVIADTGWDATGQWDRKDLAVLEQADYFVPNDAEALHYTRAQDVQGAACELLKEIPTSIITCGKNGVLLAATEGFHEFPAPAVDAIDTTGAGDAFSAGLAYGLVQETSLPDAIRLGQLCAAWTVQFLGGSQAAPTAQQLLHWTETDGNITEHAGEAIVATLGSHGSYVETATQN